LPTNEPGPLNVNTLLPGQEALLTMLVGSEELPLERAAAVIERRPFDGYRSVEQFWADEAFRDIHPGEGVLAQVGIETRYFAVRIRVTLDTAYFTMNSRFARDASGRLVLIARDFGAAQ
jgi:general secretion pathway protein K